MITRLSILKDRLSMANHNLFCYSATYAMENPKPGKEKEFTESLQEIKILEEWIAELESEVKS